MTDMATVITPCVCKNPRVVWNETDLPAKGRRIWLRCLRCGLVSHPVDGERHDSDLEQRARESWMRRLADQR